MNGFVIFPNQETVQRFMQAPELADLQDELSPSKRQPVVVYSGMTVDDIVTLKAVAEEFEGHLQKSRQYNPLAS